MFYFSVNVWFVIWCRVSGGSQSSGFVHQTLSSAQTIIQRFLPRNEASLGFCNLLEELSLEVTKLLF